MEARAWRRAVLVAVQAASNACDTNAPPSVLASDSAGVRITVDRDQTDGLKVYLDGALVSTLDPTIASGDITNSSPMYWGHNMPGMLDEMAVYQRPLTAEEVATLAAGVALEPEDCEQK